ncbi:MAG: TerB family tellurite resistance protein [Rhodospirillales bacterium]|jgi:uncharacterized tellurite resistance protein B-like protein|nr:TerB family tellurite resistance protein [Rhodospirillales bacterium]
MLAHIKSLIFGAAAGDILPSDADADADDRVAAATAVLLIETAVMDGEFAADERATIGRLLMERFGISENGVDTLMVETEQAVADSVELFSFTRVLRSDYDHADRVKMIEMMWEVAYADGVIHDYEANLIRRATGLLHVSDRESGEARKRVLERLDKEAGAA